MKEFVEHIIPGAAFDSSARHPPPRCHPGTRLAVVRRIQGFISSRTEDKRILWLVGPAGVGKSAIMQTVAENMPSVNSDITLGASLFFSVNGRDDGAKTFTTLAYQLAVNNPLYRQFLQNEMMNDLTLPQKSLTTQFKKFIVEPFALHRVDSSHMRLLIVIDGLDECSSHHTQREILGLISYLSIKYPAAPLVWIIASCPEPHITTFFSLARVVSSFEKEEIAIDSDKAREDVERYLRDELGQIRTKYPVLTWVAQWPAEHDFLKLAAASIGLFAYASTAVRFIDDSAYGDPVSKLKLVLEVIDDILSRRGEGNVHPMANLDALYAHILSRIPKDVLPNTKKLLLCLRNDRLTPAHLCNRLGITADTAYGALHHLHSVLAIPPVKEATHKQLDFLHKSFRDYLYDSERSKMFRDP